MKKRNLNILFISLIGVLFLSSCKQNDDANANSVEKVIVSVAKNEKVPLKRTLVGQTVAEETVDIRARVTGFLEKINFKWGSIVKKNDVLFEIEKSQYAADLQKAEGELVNANAALRNAEKDYIRQKSLYSKDAVSEEDYDNARLAKETASGNVISAEGVLKAAKLNLDYTTIRAPFTGKIDKPKYSVGNLVGLDSGTLATIVKLDPMQVEFSPDEIFYLNQNPTPEKRRQGSAKIKLSNNEIYKHSGSFVYSDNKIDSSTGTIHARASFANPDNYLLPGQYVNIILEKKVRQEYLVIPQEAVMTGQIGEYVYLVNKDNIIETRKITTGATTDFDIVVLTGLDAGDLVVIKDLQQVRSGEKVVPEEETTSDKAQ
jgi:membrane fusion protein, multidrug efflux system